MLIDGNIYIQLRLIGFCFYAGSAVADIISPIAFGIIIDKTGNWSLPFYGSVALLVIGIFLTFFMRPDKSL